jgi:hypothetical protein
MRRAISKFGLVVSLAVSLACISSSTAHAWDSKPCSQLFDKRYPIGWVQYCPLYGPSNSWVPVYGSKSQGQNEIGTDIVGWLMYRANVNWFWCQDVGTGWAFNEGRWTFWWAKTVTDIEPGPPYHAKHVQGWVPLNFFANDINWVPARGATMMPDDTLRFCWDL